MRLVGHPEAIQGTPDVMTADMEAFVTEHYPRLIRLAGLVTRHTEEAQDAVQAALERAWRHRSALADPQRIRPWLDRIVVRESIRVSRRRSGPLSLLGFWTQHTQAIELRDTSADPTDVVALRAAFAGLSPPQRAVVALHFYAGYSVPETAELLGVPLETARSRLRLARQRLRRAMEATA